MRIGILTFYKVMNFGATLQAVSTYCYLKNHGHTPIFINYMSHEAHQKIIDGKDDPQWQCILNFVDSIIKDQTDYCHSLEEVLEQIKKHKIDVVVAGSDALLQHHPYFARWKMGKHRPFLGSYAKDFMFPNLFWGVGLAEKIPMALMSVSSQNSEYSLFFPWTKSRMRRSLGSIRYISVRDTWSQDMLKVVLHKEVHVTPDPVFAFEQNCGDIVPSKGEILMKYNLPENYVCASFFTQNLSISQFEELKAKLNKEGKELVILPMPTGHDYKPVADKVLEFPMSPIDWYALIKYSKGYIGNNMHPIVVSLANAVPCFSLDNWGKTDFWGKKHDDGSSKVQHIMEVFGVSQNRRMVKKNKCDVSIEEILQGLYSFPKGKVYRQAESYLSLYNEMMNNILKYLTE